VLGVCWAFKRAGAGFSRLLSRNQEVEPARKEDDLPKPTVEVAGDGEKKNEKQA
jgi:hypothetical protein